jgi:hypothetical protein
VLAKSCCDRRATTSNRVTTDLQTESAHPENPVNSADSRPTVESDIKAAGTPDGFLFL